MMAEGCKNSSCSGLLNQEPFLTLVRYRSADPEISSVGIPTSNLTASLDNNFVSIGRNATVVAWRCKRNDRSDVDFAPPQLFYFRRHFGN